MSGVLLAQGTSRSHTDETARPHFGDLEDSSARVLSTDPSPRARSTGRKNRPRDDDDERATRHEREGDERRGKKTNKRSATESFSCPRVFRSVLSVRFAVRSAL
ncbi:hypothetical protein MRX96_040372 [Rhipicephalus microplus]